MVTEENEDQVGLQEQNVIDAENDDHHGLNNRVSKKRNLVQVPIEKGNRGIDERNNKG